MKEEQKEKYKATARAKYADKKAKYNAARREKYAVAMLSPEKEIIRAKINAESRALYHKNAERVAAKRATPEERAKKRAHYDRWYRAHREADPKGTWLLYVYAAAKRRCKHTNVPVEDFRDFLELPDRCPVFDTILNYSAKKTSHDSASVDRLIPERGYVKGNLYVISHRANSIKRDGTADEHLRIYEYIKRSACAS